jgi:predicted aconitase
MGVNTEGKLKVWLNSNPTKNSVDKHRTQSISDKFSSASIRVRKLYRLVEQKCIDIFLPYYIKKKFCNRHIAYIDAINLVH